MLTIQDVIEELTYIPLPEGLDGGAFSDWDCRYGFGGSCLYVKGGIVVDKETEGEYRQLIDDAYKFFSKEW